MTTRLDELFEGYPEHLTVQHLTKLLGKERTTIYKWLHEGALPGYRVGGSWVVLRDEVKDLLATGHNLSPEPPEESVE